jgi:ABC-type transporter Mla MlaB component
LDSEDLVSFVLCGRIQKEDLGKLKSLLEKHHNQAVVLDLNGVKLVDRDAVRFLASFETGQAKITNCPRYIREWIRRDGRNNKRLGAVIDCYHSRDKGTICDGHHGFSS